PADLRVRRRARRPAGDHRHRGARQAVAHPAPQPHAAQPRVHLCAQRPGRSEPAAQPVPTAPGALPARNSAPLSAEAAAPSCPVRHMHAQDRTVDGFRPGRSEPLACARRATVKHPHGHDREDVPGNRLGGPMTRLSSYFLPTLKEAPADAEATSHRLLVRAGLARQLGAGMWTFLPAGWRAHRKAEQIIREELDAIGGQEMLMPVLQPAELWKQSGRYDIDELFKLEDRRGADLVLAMTHEEAVTWHVAREVRSYRDLPMLLYHIQTKE